MNPDDLRRVIIHSCWVALLSSLLVWLFWDWPHALGLLAGGIWSAANIGLWIVLIEEFSRKRRLGRLLWITFLKLPVLYIMGACFLEEASVSIGAGIVGFHIPFLMILVKSILISCREEYRTPVHTL